MRFKARVGATPWVGLYGLFFILGVGLLFLGYTDAATAAGSTTTQNCTQGLCTTTVTNGSTQTVQVTSSTYITYTTVSGTVVQTTQTYNPSNVAVTITANPSPGTVGSDVTFTATPSAPLGANSYIYAWLFGDGSSAQGASVIHAFSGAATYQVSVSMTAYNNGGLVALGSGALNFQVQSSPLGSGNTLAVNVVSGYSGGPIAGAVITGPSWLVCYSGTAQAPCTTNSAGQLIYGNAQAGTYTVYASASGYYTGSGNVVIPSSGGASVSITLAYNCGRSLCPQSIFGSAAADNVVMGLGALFAVIGVVGLFVEGMKGSRKK